MAKKTKPANLLFLLVFLGALIVFPLWTLLGPKESVSIYENRALAKLPELHWETLLDGSFFSQLDTFYSDHLAWRTQLLTVNTWLDMKVLGKPVVNDQVLCGDVLVPFQGFSRWDTGYARTQSEDMGDRLARLNRQVTEYGGYFCYLGMVDQASYFRDRYPDYLDNRDWNMTPIHEEFSAALAARDIPFIDMLEVYKANGRLTEFSSTVDHHYTYQGMLVAYDAVMERINADTGLGLNVLTEDDLTLTALPNYFLGTRSRRLFGLWESSESVVIGELKDPIPFTRTDNGREVAPTLYTLPTSDADPVTYTVYMGGDVAETVIQTDRPELPNALIFGDSFTNPLETVFWTGFNETRSLDLRYYTAQTLEEYIRQYQPNVVICVRDDTNFLSTVGNGNLPK